ncbi:MAG: putative phosphoglycerate mutase family protein [Gemmataceae bacterium]|nr:putative phosphoglycerate mutase family protein [Gemmataceae bacterium]
MNQPLPLIYLARHGETEWSLAGRHTGLTDIPLTDRGERNARRLGDRLAGIAFARVFTSPLIRARRTCELAGFGGVAEVDPDLVEWDYGEVEGITTAEFRRQRPDWELFRDGPPGGETLAAISARADRVIARVRAVGGNVLLFSSGHISQVLGARWIGADVSWGRAFFLQTAAVSILGYHHSLGEPVIRLWNDTHHTED